MPDQENLKTSAERAQRIVAGICLDDYGNNITAFTSLGLILFVVLFGTAAVCTLILLLGILYTGLIMTVLITDVVRSPGVQFTLEKCFPGAVQKINRGLVSQILSSVILDFGRRAIATLVVGTWRAVQAIGACMIVMVDLLGPSKYSILDAFRTMKYTVDKNDLTVERTRRIPLELLQGDPVLRAAYAQGWEDRTEDMHLNIQAWNPSPARPLTILTPPAERLSLADEQTGCTITPVENKLEPTTTSAQIAAPPTRKPKGDQPMNSKKRRSMASKMEFLAKMREKAIQQTGPLLDTNVSSSSLCKIHETSRICSEKSIEQKHQETFSKTTTEKLKKIFSDIDPENEYLIRSLLYSHFGDSIGDQISTIGWSCNTLKKLLNNTMISSNEFRWATNLVQFDEATLQVSQINRIVEIPRSVLPNTSLDGFVYSGIQSLVNSEVQWQYLTCLFGEIVHGGHITEDWARKLCLTHLKVNLNPDETRNGHSEQPELNINVNKKLRKPMKNFPVDAWRFHPTMLLKQLKPGMEPQCTILSRHPSIIRVCCVIDGIEYCRYGSTKKKAVTNMCIAAIKHIFGYDYSQVVVQFS